MATSDRFKPVLRAVWLVAKRYGCYRDLRNVLLQWVRANVFDWETEQLCLERAWCLSQRRPLTPLYLSPLLVEQVPERHEWYDGLRLQRVSLRRKTFSALVDEWMWLAKH